MPSSPQGRRWLLLSVVVLTLLAMGLYTVTDTSALAHDHAVEHDHALTGADWAGYAVCHRITERSFTVAGRQLPLCARCTGIYLGVSLTFALLWLAGRSRWGALPSRPILLVLAGLVGVMGVDGINSYSHFFPDAPHLYEPRNWLRLVTGMGTGVAIGLVVPPALAQTVWKRPFFQPPVRNWRELLGVLLVAAVAVGLVLSNQPTLLYVLALVSGAGVLLIITCLNCMVGAMLLRCEGWATRWRETALPLLFCFTLALVEVGTVGWLRLTYTGTMTGLPGL